MNIKEQMDLLQMKEITTEKQKKNGTKIFQLPIKMYGKYIKVGSFKSGYVRRLECLGYKSDSSYQLNKRCESEPQYFELSNGDYRKFTTRTCKLIPNEVDRLEYLISYCLKNYYIKQANMIENGKFVPKWKHEYEMENGSINKVRELQNKIQDLELELQDAKDDYQDLSYRFEETAMELSDISVTINGHRYKVK